MQIDQVKELYDYDHWANERLWQVVEGLNAHQLNGDMHNGKGQMQGFLTTLHDKDLNRELRYIRSAAPDQVFTQPLWKTLLHLINHQMQHRSEIAMQLTALNHSPGELGMSHFFNR